MRWPSGRGMSVTLMVLRVCNVTKGWSCVSLYCEDVG